MKTNKGAAQTIELEKEKAGNQSPAYERFFYTRHLLNNKYHDFIVKLGDKKKLQEFKSFIQSLEMSDADFSQLLDRINDWNNLQAPIPLEYLDFIGIKPISIETTAKADMDLFKKSIQNTFYPGCFFVNVPHGLISVALPQGTNEKEAIRHAINWNENEDFISKYICIKDLKTIIIQPNGNYYTITYPPILTRRKNLLIPSRVEDSNCGKPQS